jgi:glucokinase
LESKLECPVSVANDANLAALGEWRHGAGRGKDYVIYLTLSTGIGGGVIADGRLLQGADGLAPELGHMSVVPDGPLCGCGRQGHLEALAAGPALARRAQERLTAGEASERLAAAARDRELTAEDVGRAGLEGDPLAVAVISETAEYIGLHLAQLAHAFNPELFVLGGGLSRMGDLLFEPIRLALQENIMHPSFLEGLEVVPAELGDDAGLVGAMLMASEL